MVQGAPCVVAQAATPHALVKGRLHNGGGVGRVLRQDLDLVLVQRNCRVPRVHLAHPLQRLLHLLVRLHLGRQPHVLGHQHLPVLEAQQHGGGARGGDILGVTRVHLLHAGHRIGVRGDDVVVEKLDAWHAGVIRAACRLHGLDPHIVTLQHEDPRALDHGLVGGRRIKPLLDGIRAVGHRVVTPPVTLWLLWLGMERGHLIHEKVRHCAMQDTSEPSEALATWVLLH
mmetsp:Transcript_32743/g.83063  ORF Transcript_32743/g.83063 Transcript_32743/m.83063 type:complete len:228 (-) Transcript_32743:508-1191(-)